MDLPGPVQPQLALVIAEDETLLREGLARLLTELGFRVVGTAGTAERAISLVQAARPQVLVTDIRMPPAWRDEGLALAEHVEAHHPDVGVLVLSQHLETEYAVRLLSRRTQGIGYLLKSRVGDLQMLAEAIRRVGAGGAVIDPEVVALLVGRRRPKGPLDELSARERDVLALMAEGLSNTAICERLFLSRKTVESHVRSIFSKLDLSPDRGESRRVLAVLSHLRATSGPLTPD